MAGYINTIADLEAQTYGMNLPAGNALLKQAGMVGGIHTGHDGSPSFSGSAVSDVSALYNVVYGQKVWSMLNREVNALSMISKRPYTSSGWRVLMRFLPLAFELHKKRQDKDFDHNYWNEEL